jgi:serine phosphatase RsbU (regulator of sigma subunit)
MLRSEDFEDRLRRLQRVSLDLSAAMSIGDIAAAVIEVFDAPVSAPSRGLYLLDDSGDFLRLIAQRGMPPAAAALFERLAISADLPGSVAVRERRTVISTERADAISEFEALRDVPRSTSGFVAIPLMGDESCVGVLALGFDLALDDRDVEFLEAVAAQVAQAVIRVRLLERERRRRVELEFLAQLTDTALEAADHLDLMRRVCAAAVPTLGDYCSLYFVAETGAVPEVAFAHVDPEQTSFLEELMRRYPFDPERAVGPPAVIRTGRTEFIPRLTPQVIDDAIASLKLSRDEAMPIVERLGITSAITVALRTKRRIVGAMQFVSARSGRQYGDSDVALAEAAAGRLAEALDGAWMADHQRSVALSLQHALLPPALPTIPGVDLAARYWPAGIDDVGGDFYDVFQIADDDWAIVIGDVCGTGPDAAATTSIARHTIRAAARHGADPSVVMDWLNDAVLRSQRQRFCTACYATLTSHDGRWTLTTTAAGHPLPIVSTDRGAHMIGNPGTLAGVFEHITVWPERITVESGDRVVLYTDGITDLPAPHGIDPAQLVDLVHRHRDESAGGLADVIHRSLLDRVPDRRRRDDAAVLVLAIR